MHRFDEELLYTHEINPPGGHTLHAFTIRNVVVPNSESPGDCRRSVQRL